MVAASPSTLILAGPTNRQFPGQYNVLKFIFESRLREVVVTMRAPVLVALLGLLACTVHARSARELMHLSPASEAGQDNSACCKKLEAIGFNSTLPVAILDTGGRAIDEKYVDINSTLCTCNSGHDFRDYKGNVVASVHGSSSALFDKKWVDEMGGAEERREWGHCRPHTPAAQVPGACGGCCPGHACGSLARFIVAGVRSQRAQPGCSTPRPEAHPRPKPPTHRARAAGRSRCA